MKDSLPQLYNNGNQKTSHYSNYIKENISEIYDGDKLPEDNFLIKFKIIGKYQGKDRGQMNKLKSAKYQCGSIFGVINNSFDLITCEDNIVIPSTFQICVFNCYRIYLLHIILNRM